MSKNLYYFASVGAAAPAALSDEPTPASAFHEEAPAGFAAKRATFCDLSRRISCMFFRKRASHRGSNRREKKGAAVERATFCDLSSRAAWTAGVERASLCDLSRAVFE